MKLGTHDGTFHADEAVAVATLRLPHGPSEVVRTRDPERLAECNVRVDVGLRDDPATGVRRGEHLRRVHVEPGPAANLAMSVPPTP